MASTTDRRVGGRYELVRRIARGGGGTVWAGYDHLLERDVAVKHVAIPDDLPAPERELLRARVRSEARAAARLLHPSAVAIFDVVADDGDVHLVLELVEDPTLDDLVARTGPLPVTEAAAVGLRLLDVLMAAHERGIVHRDVKPSNIFVSESGEVKLTDFGIASMDGEARLTRTGATMGSPQFIAPEQALGHDAAPPADLWGLGASLYLAVEGVPPFERGNAVATVHAVVHDPARPFERAGDLAPILTRLLEKEPDDRPDETWLREEFSRVAGIEVPHVEAAATTVIPVRSSTTEAPAAAGPSDVASEPAEAAPEPAPTSMPAGEEDTALSASVEVPTPSPRADEDGDDEAARSTGTSTRDPQRRWIPVAAVLALVAVVALAQLIRSGGGGDEPGTDDEVAASGEQAEDDGEPDTADGAPDGETSEDDSDGSDDATAADDGADDEGADDQADAAAEGVVLDDENVVLETEVPDDWEAVEGPAYEVAVPADWEEVPREGRIVDHRDPDSSTYLRVDWNPSPHSDVYENWQQMDERLAQDFEDYERHQLTEGTYRGEPAALLEYSYTAGGARLHAYNLNLVSGDRAYALNLQSREEDWDEVAPMFTAITGGFAPQN